MTCNRSNTRDRCGCLLIAGPLIRVEDEVIQQLIQMENGYDADDEQEVPIDGMPIIVIDDEDVNFWGAIIPWDVD